MRGISFKVNKSDKCVLSNILDGIDIESLFWHISEDEIYLNKGENLFAEKCIDGKTFAKKISESVCSVICANIKAFADNCMSDKAINYNDFLMSNCLLVILCSDVSFYEIYVKNEEMLELIRSNCHKNCYDEIEDITDVNDVRKIFSVI